MEAKIYHFTWFQFFLFAALGFSAIKFIGLIKIPRDSMIYNYKIANVIRNYLQKAVISSEPVIIVFLVAVFVSINHLYNGIIVLVSILIFFPNLRDYFVGRILLFNSTIEINQKIKIKEHNGIVRKIGRFGLQIQTKTTKIHIRYTDVYKNNLIVINENESSSEICILDIKSKKKIKLQELKNSLIEFMATVPFVEHSFKPQLKTDFENGSVTIKILLKKDIPTEHLIKLLEENYFACTQIHEF